MPANHNPSVRIRMYRQGLGDCFLLTFTENGKQEFNMMIDCGVLQKTTNDKEIMTAVVEDIEKSLTIKKTIKGEEKKWLDVVVLTHEHADHISGFTKAKDVFERIHFGEVWASWLDDKTHPKYKDVRKRFKAQINGLRAAMAKMGANDPQGVRGVVEAVLTEFFEDEVLGANTNGEPGRSPSYDYALKKSLADPKYFTPGKAFPLPGFDVIRIYILGPSEDFESFTQVNPTAEDTYRKEKNNLGLVDSFFAAVSNDPSLPSESFQPFDKRLRISVTDANQQQFFKDHYGFDSTSVDAWRRIDDDWLAAAGGIALNLDSYTNNTCLAIAIEFLSSGKVLLFPGDAQFSNWLSWQALSWEFPDGNGTKQKVTAKDLLERTIFYKVGHHGSHNATLKKHGLEMMTNPNLMAMIPVDRDQAKAQVSKTNPNGWEMPEKNLYDRLMEKTRGRIIIADESSDVDLKKRCEDKAFLKNLKFDGSFVRNSSESTKTEPLCIELTIKA